jgi:hypothetical protein
MPKSLFYFHKILQDPSTILLLFSKTLSLLYVELCQIISLNHVTKVDKFLTTNSTMSLDFDVATSYDGKSTWQRVIQYVLIIVLKKFDLIMQQCDTNDCFIFFQQYLITLELTRHNQVNNYIRTEYKDKIFYYNANWIANQNWIKDELKVN